MISVLLEAGVVKFSCPEFSVEFPPPLLTGYPLPTEPTGYPLPTMPAATAQGSFPQPDQRSAYDRLFGGNKPTLGSPE